MTFTIRSLASGGALSAALLLVCAAGCNKSQSAAPRFDPKNSQESAWQTGAEKPPAPKTLYAMAGVLAAEGRLSDAALILREVIRQTPTAQAAYVQLAGICMRQHQPASAKEVLTAGLKISPNDPVMLNDLGVAHLALRDPGKALPAFEKAVAAAPASRLPRYQSNMALALALLGRYDEALTAYERVVSPSEAHHNVAVICESREDKERATVEYARALMLSSAKGRSRPCTSHGETAIASSAPAIQPAAVAAVAPAGPPAVSALPADNPSPVAEEPIVRAESPAAAMSPVSIDTGGPGVEAHPACQIQPIEKAEAEPALPPDASATVQAYWWPELYCP